MVIALRLATSGYCNGDPEKILTMPVSIVLNMMNYEIFKDEYEKVFIEINKEE
jgi:hypothetical protein